MAEALAGVGIITNIVQLVDLGHKVVSRLNEYQSKGRRLPEAFSHIAIQLPLLLDILDKAEGGFSNRIIPDDTAKVLKPNIDGCLQQIERLDKILDKVVAEKTDNRIDKLAKGVRSLWKESDVREIDTSIQDYVIRLTFYCAWSSSDLDPRNHRLLRDIRRWLDPPDPAVNLSRALKLRTAHTGAWLLQGQPYADWKAPRAPIPGSFLWLHGSAGSGKTILTSGILEGLVKDCKDDPAKSLAFFFFDFNDSSKQRLTGMLKSVVSQLLDKCVEIPQLLQDAYASSQNGSREPSSDKLLQMMKALVQSLPTSYLVLDALDECSERSALMETLTQISDWGADVVSN